MGLNAEWSLSDGVIAIRPPRAGDSARLIAGRDGEWERWLGPGSDDPQPTACIIVDDTIVGWVDYDVDRERLAPGEVNIGYNVFAPYRRRGYATRAISLLMQKLASDSIHRRGVLSIDRGNVASQGVAKKAGFVRVEDGAGQLRFARAIEPAEAPPPTDRRRPLAH